MLRRWRDLGVSTNPQFSAQVDLRGHLDGPVEVRCDARDRVGNVGTEKAVATEKNWTERFKPHELNLRSNGRYVRMVVRNIVPVVSNIGVLLRSPART